MRTRSQVTARPSGGLRAVLLMCDACNGSRVLEYRNFHTTVPMRWCASIRCMRRNGIYGAHARW